MDLKAEREKILEQLQRNKVDTIKNEQMLSGLRNGAVYLRGQLELVERLISEESKKDAKNEDVSPDLQSPTVPAPVRQHKGAERNTGSATGDNSKSGN